MSAIKNYMYDRIETIRQIAGGDDFDCPSSDDLRALRRAVEDLLTLMVEPPPPKMTPAKLVRGCLKVRGNRRLIWRLWDAIDNLRSPEPYWEILYAACPENFTTIRPGAAYQELQAEGGAA